MRSRSPSHTSARRPVVARVDGVVRHRLEGRGRRRGRGRSQASAGNPLSARVVRALDSMDALAHFARAYERGAAIPDTMWEHAEVISDYLGYPPPKRWLWTWLNDPERKRD